MPYPVIDLARSLIRELQASLTRRRARAEVRVKRNARGKIVIGVLLDPEQPLDVRAGDDPDEMLSTRERKRRARAAR